MSFQKCTDTVNDLNVQWVHENFDQNSTLS